MGTMKLSIPDDIKDAFEKAFDGQDMSLVIAQLMQEAIAEAEQKQRRHDAVEKIRQLRKSMPSITTGEIDAARGELRK